MAILIPQTFFEQLETIQEPYSPMFNDMDEDTDDTAGPLGHRVVCTPIIRGLFVYGLELGCMLKAEVSTGELGCSGCIVLTWKNHLKAPSQRDPKIY